MTTTYQQKRMRLAFHEAGHAVLSAAINDKPREISIRHKGASDGRSVQKMFAPATTLVQLCLAGFAAEHVHTGRVSRGYRSELAFAISHWHVSQPAPSGFEDTDCFLAVDQVVRIAKPKTTDELRAETQRFYEIAKQSLSAVWPTVESVAEALLKHGALDQDAVCDVFVGHDIYAPVRAVQDAHGLRPYG